jgi:heme exporter protein C
MDKLIKKWWWKILAVVLMLYVVCAGLLFDVPRLVILNETIRVLHFHVPMWFGMILLLLASVVYAIKNLSNPSPKNDIYSLEFANVGVAFGVMGIVTGMIWANFTWGEPWSNDPKQNASAIGILIYFAYFILRGSIEDENTKARISAVYNIFAFAILIPLLFILPRLTDSLHPGNGGNPGFNAYDLDSKLRKVFYTAVIGWSLIGFWIATIRIRMRLVQHVTEQ